MTGHTAACAVWLGESCDCGGCDCRRGPEVRDCECAATAATDALVGGERGLAPVERVEGREGWFLTMDPADVLTREQAIERVAEALVGLASAGWEQRVATAAVHALLGEDR